MFIRGPFHYLSPADAGRGGATAAGPTPPLVSADRPRFLKDLRTDRFWEKESAAIERDGILADIFTTLALREKRSIILTGEAGVGKTALMYEVIRRIDTGRIPALKDRSLFLLDIPVFLESTQESPVLPGTLENRLRGLDTYTAGLLNGAIIFVDEIGRLFDLPGLGGAMKLSVHLKESLARQLTLFGTTTQLECKKMIENDPPLERRLNPLEVPTMSVVSATAVLRAGNAKREEHFSTVGGKRVRVPERSLKEAAVLAGRFFTGRALPDSALTVMERACATRVNAMTTLRLEIEDVIEKIHLQFGVALRSIRDGDEAELIDAKKDLVRLATLYYQRLEQLSALGKEREIRIVSDDVLQALAYLTKIPVAKLGGDEKEKLLHLEEHLSRRVIGQNEAKKALADAVRRARTLPKPGAPYGVFLFAGPTGVGKTEIAKALAESLLGDESAMIRFDMSEFIEKNTHARLLGAPPGFVGFEQGGELTNAVRKTPYCVVLLDEFEKAHPVIWRTLLSAFGEARLTDARGQHTDFTNVLFIMTSNLAAQDIQVAVRGVTDPEQKKQMRTTMLEKALDQTFPPEFRGRLTSVIHFDPLDEEDLSRILDIKLARVARQIREKICELETTEALRRHVLRQGYHAELGARPMENALENLLVNPLATALLAGTIPPGTIIRADSDGEKVILTSAGQIAKKEFLMPDPDNDGRVGASVYRLLTLIDVKASEGLVEVNREEMENILSPREEKVQAALSSAVAAGLMPTGRVVFNNDDYRRKDLLLGSLASNLAALGRIGNFQAEAVEALSEFVLVIGSVAKEAKDPRNRSDNDPHSDKNVEMQYDFSGNALKVFVRTSLMKKESPLQKRLGDNLITPMPKTENDVQDTYRRLQKAGDRQLLKLKQLVVSARGAITFIDDEKGTQFLLSVGLDSKVQVNEAPEPAIPSSAVALDVENLSATPSASSGETEVVSIGTLTLEDRGFSDDLFLEAAGDPPAEGRDPISIAGTGAWAPARDGDGPAYIGGGLTKEQVLGKSPRPPAASFLPVGRDGFLARLKLADPVPIPQILNVLSFCVTNGQFQFAYVTDETTQACLEIKKAAAVSDDYSDSRTLEMYVLCLVASMREVRSLSRQENYRILIIFKTLFTSLGLTEKNRSVTFKRQLGDCIETAMNGARGTGYAVLSEMRSHIV